MHVGAVMDLDRTLQQVRPVRAIERFSVGSVHLRDKRVGVINLEGLIRTNLLEATPPVAGLLGSEILQRHNGIIDFGTRTLYLKN
jgi:hypothetical protein